MSSEVDRAVSRLLMLREDVGNEARLNVEVHVNVRLLGKSMALILKNR